MAFEKSVFLMESASPNPKEDGAGLSFLGDDEQRQESSCRICLLDLEEGCSGGSSSKDWLQMDCLCKGELAIAHVACAIRWFRIRGNSSCDICGHAVGNLPVFIPCKLWNQNHQNPQQLLLQQLDHQHQPEQNSREFYRAQEAEDDDYYDPIDSSWSKIAALILTATLGFFRQKLEDLAEFP